MIVSEWLEIQPFFNSLHELEISCFGNSTWDKATWEKLFENISLFVRLEFQDELLTGFSVVSVVIDEAELLRIAVRKELRYKGIGKKLLERSKQHATTLGCKSMFLEVRADNRGAAQLYQHCGFKVIGQRSRYYTNPTCDALLFSMKLL